MQRMKSAHWARLDIIHFTKDFPMRRYGKIMQSSAVRHRQRQGDDRRYDEAGGLLRAGEIAGEGGRVSYFRLAEGSLAVSFSDELCFAWPNSVK